MDFRDVIGICTVYPMSNQPGNLVGISSYCDKAGLPLLLDQMCLGHILRDHLQAPYSLWRRASPVVDMGDLPLWARAELINLEVSKFLVFHFMLDDS